MIAVKPPAPARGEYEVKFFECLYLPIVHVKLASAPVGHPVGPTVGHPVGPPVGCLVGPPVGL